MTIQILNDIYSFIEKTCKGKLLYYCNGSFAAGDERGDICVGNDPKDWELIDLGLVANRVMEHINSEGYDKIYLYVCPDESYVCIEDPKDLDEDTIDCYEENDSGLMVGLD